MKDGLFWAKISSNLVIICLSAFLCAKTALQLRRERQGQRRSQFKDLLAFPDTLLFITGSLTVAVQTILLQRAYYNYRSDDEVYKCIECSSLADVLDSIFESLTWIIALYVLWRVAKRQGGWRGTISRMCLYGGYLCALIIVLCTLFNVMHTPKELAPLDGSIKASNIQKNHTAPAEESIANPASIEHISMDPIIDNVANEAEQASSESMSEQEPAMPKIDEDMETLSQPSAPESVHRSDADTAEPFRFADTIDIPAVISWILHIGAQWSMAGLVPLLTYMQREQIPSICSFAAYGVLVTLFPVATGICNILAALYVALGYALYSVHPMEGDKIDEETMEYLKERAETWSTLTMLALQYMLVIALYLAAWFGRKWEATHLRQHLHDDHDAYRFDSYPHDAKQPILGLNEKPDHIRQGSRDYATAVDVDLTRRSV